MRRASRVQSSSIVPDRMWCRATRASADSRRIAISLRPISREKMTLGRLFLIDAARAKSSASVDLPMAVCGNHSAGAAVGRRGPALLSGAAVLSSAVALSAAVLSSAVALSAAVLSSAVALSAAVLCPPPFSCPPLSPRPSRARPGRPAG
ncbi:hypothetical protein SANTM175S_04159 [Streptomyces antimycoticus]